MMQNVSENNVNPLPPAPSSFNCYHPNSPSSTSLLRTPQSTQQFRDFPNPIHQELIHPLTKGDLVISRQRGVQFCK